MNLFGKVCDKMLAKVTAKMHLHFFLTEGSLNAAAAVYYLEATAKQAIALSIAALTVMKCR